MAAAGTGASSGVTTIVVLFNLKPGVSVADYERFASELDLPTVNGLPSIAQFEVLRSKGLLRGGAGPYQYIEILRVKNMEQFGSDVSTATMQSIAAQFRSFADNPQFILTEALGS
jgi:REDY-like protein HapK